LIEWTNYVRKHKMDSYDVISDFLADVEVLEKKKVCHEAHSISWLIKYHEKLNNAIIVLNAMDSPDLQTVATVLGSKFHPFNLDAALFPPEPIEKKILHKKTYERIMNEDMDGKAAIEIVLLAAFNGSITKETCLSMAENKSPIWKLGAYAYVTDTRTEQCLEYATQGLPIGYELFDSEGDLKTKQTILDWMCILASTAHDHVFNNKKPGNEKWREELNKIYALDNGIYKERGFVIPEMFYRSYQFVD
jgi:hypothetical protein